MAENILGGLFKEMNRVRELKKMYDEIPEGRYGSIILQQSLDRAEKAIKESDVIGMIAAYDDLKERQ